MERKRRKKADPSVIRTRKHHFYLTVGAGTLLVLGLVINLFVPSRTFSENENRSLAQRPALTLSALTDGSFAQGFSDYYADQFAARDGWTSLNYRLSRLLGQKDFSTVYAGKDGYLLGTPETPDETALARTIAAVNDFAAAYPDVEMNLMAVPDAAATLADKLPKHAPVRDQRSDLAALYQRMEGVGTIDAAAVLSTHASEDIYYKTDHHWTSYGAFLVFQEAADRLGLDLSSVGYEPHTVSESFQGTLASKSGDYSSRDTITVYEPVGSDVKYYVNYTATQTKVSSLFVPEKLEEKDQYTVFFGGNHPLVDIVTTANNGRRLLLFKDSYANCFVQFLTPHYEEIVMVDPRYYYDDIASVMGSYGITDVLFLYSADTLFKDTALADTLEAGLAKLADGETAAPAVQTEEVPEETSEEELSEEETGEEDAPEEDSEDEDSDDGDSDDGDSGEEEDSEEDEADSEEDPSEEEDSGEEESEE